MSPVGGGEGILEQTCRHRITARPAMTGPAAGLPVGRALWREDGGETSRGVTAGGIEREERERIMRGMASGYGSSGLLPQGLPA